MQKNFGGEERTQKKKKAGLQGKICKINTKKGEGQEPPGKRKGVGRDLLSIPLRKKEDSFSKSQKKGRKKSR